MKAWILSHVVNGKDAVAQIPQLGGSSIGELQRQLDEFWISKSKEAERTAKLLCVKVGNSINDGCMDYDRRMDAYLPPGGDCSWSWPEHSQLTIICFNAQRPFLVQHHCQLNLALAIPH